MNAAGTERGDRIMDDQTTMVTDTIRQVIANELGCPPEMISADSGVSDLSGMDSLTLFRIVTTLEYEFDIILDDEQVYEISSVGDLVQMVEGERENSRP
jgi:acyl carrier protein